MGLCISTVVTTNPPQSVADQNTVQEVVQKQPVRRKDFGADDSPLPTAGCCLCCIDPNWWDLCCCGCDCNDCACCNWCLDCDCCLECDECCGECLGNCI